MAKSERTPTQKKRRYNLLSKLCFGGEFLSVGTPFAVLCIINRNTYFINETSSFRVTTGFIIAALTLSLAVYLIEKKNITNSLVTLFIGWGIVLGIFWLIEELLQDILSIMFWTWLGIGSALGLDMTKDNLKAKAEEIAEAIKQANKEQLVDDYKEEQKAKAEKKQKVRF